MRGLEIREARLRRGWTQSELAARVGSSQASISTAESGQHVSPSLLAKIDRVLQQDENPPEAVAPVLRFSLPRVQPAEILGLPVALRTWSRPELSGDFFLLHPLGRETLLLIAADVAGHGLSVVPSSYFLQGWLMGWTRARAGEQSRPRLEDLALDFSRFLASAEIEAACYFAYLWRQAGQTLRYEAISCGFPPPLLLVGDGFETRTSAELGPPLPSDRIAPSLVATVEAPWRLAVASDGLLSRLGEGNEPRGLKLLRQWQSGSTRDDSPESWLASDTPVTDDESFLLLTWEGWDLDLTFNVGDDAERHRAIRTVDQDVAQALGATSSPALQQAVVEALDNARRHAYPAGSGAVFLRGRREGRRYRVEIEDVGSDNLSPGQARASGGGFEIMRRRADRVDVRRGAQGGTVVTLVFGEPKE